MEWNPIQIDTLSRPDECEWHFILSKYSKIFLLDLNWFKCWKYFCVLCRKIFFLSKGAFDCVEIQSGKMPSNEISQNLLPANDVFFGAVSFFYSCITRRGASKSRAAKTLRKDSHSLKMSVRERVGWEGRGWVQMRCWANEKDEKNTRKRDRCTYTHKHALPNTCMHSHTNRQRMKWALGYNEKLRKWEPIDE